MEAATKTKARDDTELALRLGAMMLFCFGGRAGEVVRAIDESGLSFVQMKAMVSLEGVDEDDLPTVTGLSDTLGISPASASRAVDGLVKKGLASRVEDAEDRRVRRLGLTAKGHQLAGRILAARLAGLEDFAASLNVDERKKLETALEALIQRPQIAEIYETYERRVRR
jgi:MarR family 2-MHQ and catechol resistance regulon transcriptional repressor